MVKIDPREWRKILASGKSTKFAEVEELDFDDGEVVELSEDVYSMAIAANMT